MQVGEERVLFQKPARIETRHEVLLVSTQANKAATTSGAQGRFMVRGQHLRTNRGGSRKTAYFRSVLMAFVRSSMLST
jgi:hypothetical protein